MRVHLFRIVETYCSPADSRHRDVVTPPHRTLGLIGIRYASSALAATCRTCVALESLAKAQAPAAPGRGACDRPHGKRQSAAARPDVLRLANVQPEAATQKPLFGTCTSWQDVARQRQFARAPRHPYL